MLTFTPAATTHATTMAPKLRGLDLEELRLTGATDAEQALIHAVLLSDDRAVTAIEDGEPIAMFGIMPQYLLGEAIPWMLGTDAVARHGRAIVKWGRPICDRWLREFPVLMNEVWVGNVPAVLFLKHLGFSFAEPRQNEYGAEMSLFYMRRS